MGMGMGEMGMMGSMGGMGAMGSMYGGVPGPQQADVVGKGKGRFVELDDADWETHFARVGESVSVAEPMTEEGRAEPTTMNLLDGDIVLDASDADAELLASLEETWSKVQASLTDASSSDAEMAAWEAQYGSQFADLSGDSGLGEDLDLPAPSAVYWTKDNIGSFLENKAQYPFANENVYLDHPDPFAEGQRLLAAGAPLSEAALAFEAACRIDETRAEAWRAAGETWAADEREVKGIRALEKAVACGGPDGIAAWMVRLPSCLPTLLFDLH